MAYLALPLSFYICKEVKQGVSNATQAAQPRRRLERKACRAGCCREPKHLVWGLKRSLVIAVSFLTSVTRGMEAFYSRRWGEKDHSTKNKQKKTTSLRNQDERPCHTGPGQKTPRGHPCHHPTEPHSPAAGDFTDPWQHKIKAQQLLTSKTKKQKLTEMTTRCNFYKKFY